MDLIQIREFFAEYSASAIISATLIALINNVLICKIKNKALKRIMIFAPFLAGVIFTVVYESIINKVFCFNEQTIAMGITSGTLSYVISVIIKKIKNGERIPTDKNRLTILSLIENYVKQEALNSVALAIEEVLFGNEDNQNEPKTDKIKIDLIAEILLNNLCEDLTELDVVCLAEIIFQSTSETTE